MDNIEIKDTVSPKQKRSKESKENILRCAIDIFANKGLSGARIDEIASASGVNKQRIYAYFGSKENLYRQVLLNIYAKAAESKKISALCDSDIPEMTKILLETFFEFHQNNPLFWRLLAWENLNGGKSLSGQDWQQIQSSYTDHIKNLYHLGQKREIFKKEVNFTTYMLMIFSISFFYYSNKITISHLLNLNLEAPNYTKGMLKQIHSIISFGITIPL